MFASQSFELFTGLLLYSPGLHKSIVSPFAFMSLVSKCESLHTVDHTVWIKGRQLQKQKTAEKETEMKQLPGLIMPHMLGCLSTGLSYQSMGLTEGRNTERIQKQHDNTLLFDCCCCCCVASVQGLSCFIFVFSHSLHILHTHTKCTIFQNTFHISPPTFPSTRR